MTKEQRVGLFVVLGLVLAFAAVELTVGTGLVRPGFRLYVHYPTVEGLRRGDPVHVAGVKLGRVDGVALAEDGVVVTLKVEKGAVVHRDSVALLDYHPLSGSRFVSVSLGTPSAGRLGDGGTLPGELSPSLTQMVDQLHGVTRSVEELARSFNENQERFFRNINRLVEENSTALQESLQNLRSITAKLDGGDGSAARLLNEARLYERADTLLTDLQQISAKLARGDGDLARLLDGDGRLYEELQATLSSLQVTIANVDEITSRLRDGEGTLGKMIADDSLYEDAQRAARSLDRAANLIANLF